MTRAIDIALSSQERTILDDIAPQRDALIETLKQWSSINSGSHNRNGLDRMRGVILDYAQSLPVEATTAQLSESEYVDEKGAVQNRAYAPAIKLAARPKAPIQLVLTGHYDTVFPEGGHFQTPKQIDSDTINGPGVADMKGGILVMLEGLKALEQHAQSADIGYTVLLSPDEEIGSPGSGPLLSKLGQQAHVGLTYEPALADGSLAGARKGSGNFAVIVRGKAAHAGREHHLGRNAIAALAEFIGGLEKLNGRRDGVTFNIAKIDGGGASNIVPDLAIGRFNVRMKETDDMAWIEKKLMRLVDKLNRKDGISAKLTGGFTRPPKPMAPANEMVFGWVKSAGAALGQEIKWSSSGGVCEGNNLWAAGCPNVDTLGVRGANIHSDQEIIKLSSLVERSQLSALILMKLASREFDAHAVKALAKEHG